MLRRVTRHRMKRRKNGISGSDHALFGNSMNSCLTMQYSLPRQIPRINQLLHTYICCCIRHPHELPNLIRTGKPKPIHPSQNLGITLLKSHLSLPPLTLYFYNQTTFLTYYFYPSLCSAEAPYDIITYEKQFFIGKFVSILLRLPAQQAVPCVH